MRIDAHQHFWSPQRGDYGWMDGNVAVASIRRPILPAEYEPHRAAAGIDRTVLVQAAPSLFETEYMLGIADATPWVAKVVGWIDFEDRSHRRQLERFARHPKFAGVRPMIQDIADPDWMLRPDIAWAFEAIVDLDLSFDALGHPRHLDNFRRLFERWPTMRTVIDHGMKPAIRDGAFEPWAAQMTAIARDTPVLCKLSGLATEAASGWTADTLQPYAELILSVFGEERVMWGSDWPVLELAGSFAQWLDAARAMVVVEAQEAVFGGTAQRFYRIA